jgi:hypothetical protein
MKRSSKQTHVPVVFVAPSDVLAMTAAVRVVRRHDIKLTVTTRFESWRIFTTEAECGAL